jgi:flavin-dependent dehydrogenase
MISVETVVVGGGPAGAATACRLAGARREVMLFERASEPQHKVCGEFLSIEAQEQLTQLGVDPRRFGAVPIDYVSVHSRSGNITVELPFRGLSVSRFRLDSALLQSADRLGAQLKRGCAVRSVVRDGHVWRLRCADDSAVSCQNLVVATGKQHLRGLEDARKCSLVGLKMHFKPCANMLRALDHKVELFLLNDGYAGLEMVENGIANLCLVLPRSIVAGLGHDLSRLQEYLAAMLPIFRERLEGAMPLWKQPIAIVCPARGYVHQGSPGVETSAYRVGDRLAHIPPFTGDGIAIALCSAALASEHIRLGRPAAAYLASARKLTARTVRRASAIAWLAENKPGRVVLTNSAKVMPTLVRRMAQLTRLPCKQLQDGN